MNDELEVTEMLDFVDYNAERAEQEAQEEDDLILLNMEAGGLWTFEFDDA